ncbi:hypothetical protein CEXT_754261 [Caerostris extrusa]|uniref:Ribosomal protein S14 n=1 Tax=Caerostris extrusa TaxID=172846 RepID=A0AAV4XIK3_CAEEX|nr:hypothetical protein CEXT_754261 [Caerostris extrusa]
MTIDSAGYTTRPLHPQSQQKGDVEDKPPLCASARKIYAKTARQQRSSWQHLQWDKLLFNNFIRCPETGRIVQSSSQINLRGCSLRIFFGKKGIESRGGACEMTSRALIGWGCDDII